MHTDWFDPELVRAAFLLGIVVAVLAYERLQVTTSSIVVPGYLGLAAFAPRLVLTTFAVAWLVYLAIHSWSARFVVLSRAGKFHLAIVVAALLQALLIQGGGMLAGGGDADWMSIGFIIPGLIAHEMARQGPWKTSAAVLASSALVALAVLGAMLLLPDLAHGTRPALARQLAFGSEWLPLAMVASVLGSVALQRNWGLRCGGFVGAAYLSQMVARPAEIACYAAFAALTYVVVSHGLKPRLMLFGRRKFATMMIVGCLVSWAGIALGARFVSADFFHSLSAGRAVISVFLAGLLANDVDRSGPWIALRGTALCCAFSLLCTLTAIELSQAARPAVALPLGLAAAGLAAGFFGRDLVRLFPVLRPRGAVRRASALITPARSLALERRDLAFDLRQIAGLCACSLALLAVAAATGVLPGWRVVHALEGSETAIERATRLETGRADHARPAPATAGSDAARALARESVEAPAGDDPRTPAVQQAASLPPEAIETTTRRPRTR